MNAENEVQAGPVVTVARDLTELVKLHEALIVQAIHKATDRLMPGGEAMVALASVGSPDEWSELLAAEEFQHLAVCRKLDHSRCRYAEHAGDDDGHEPPLQTLLFWSEAWRARAGYALERRATIKSEANYIKGTLEWAWDNEPAWDDFAKDVKAARARMEGLLMAGVRAERGAPCLYDACRGERLIRKLVPYRNAEGDKAWKHSDWHCPKCKRSWDETRYASMVTAAHEAAKVETIDGETWCAIDYAARDVGRSPKTIRTWIERDEVSSVCILLGRRVRFVSLVEVRAKHERATRRKRAA